MFISSKRRRLRAPALALCLLALLIAPATGSARPLDIRPAPPPVRPVATVSAIRTVDRPSHELSLAAALSGAALALALVGAGYTAGRRRHAAHPSSS